MATAASHARLTLQHSVAAEAVGTARLRRFAVLDSITLVFVCPSTGAWPMSRPVSCFIILSIAVRARAQTTTSGGLHGVVKDQHGAVLPGVLMSMTSPTVPGVKARNCSS
jgi:hypothetical protein